MFVLIGNIGSGVEEAAMELYKYGYKKRVPFTTRQLKAGETVGLRYNYVTNRKFDRYKASHSLIYIKEEEPFQYADTNRGITIRTGVEEEWFSEPMSACIVSPTLLSAIRRYREELQTVFIDTPKEIIYTKLLEEGLSEEEASCISENHEYDKENVETDMRIENGSGMLSGADICSYIFSYYDIDIRSFKLQDIGISRDVCRLLEKKAHCTTLGEAKALLETLDAVGGGAVYGFHAKQVQKIKTQLGSVLS